MKKNTLLPFLLLLLLAGCQIDKINETERLVNEVAQRRNCGFMLQITADKKRSELAITTQCDSNFQAFITGSLYDIITELRKNNLPYDHYLIKNNYDALVWEIENSDFGRIQKTVNQAEDAMALLAKGEFEKFLALANRTAITGADSVLIRQFKEIPGSKNAAFQGFDIFTEKFNGQDRQFLRIYFLDPKGNGTAVVMSIRDNQIYGVHVLGSL